MLVASCATPSRDSAPREPEATPRFHDLTGDVTARIYTESSVSSDLIPANPDAVWTALISVYEDLEVPLALQDREGGQIGNPQFGPRRLAGQRLSRFLECGSGLTAAPYADQYSVTLYLVSRIAAAGDGETRLRTEVEAMAKPWDVSASPVYCTSKRTLEAMIVERVSEKLREG